MTQQATNGQAIEKADTPVRRLGRLLEEPKMLQTLRDTSMGLVDPRRFAKVVLSCVSRTPALQECTPDSIVLACIQSAELGLELGGLGGEAYLVPFKRKKKTENGRWVEWHEATCIPGYQGLMKVARRSGEIEDIDAHVVFAEDDFDFAYGAKPYLTHKPKLVEEPPTKIIKGLAWENRERVEVDVRVPDFVAVYAIAWLKSGREKFTVIPASRVEAIRARSKSGGDGPWITDYETMACKTGVRALCKYLPKSDLLDRVLALDGQAERGEGVSDLAGEAIAGAVGVPPSAAKAPNRRAANLADRIKANAPAPATSPPSTPEPAEDAPPPDDGGGFEPEPEAS